MIPVDAGHLSHNLILFGRVLRGLGIDVNPGRMIDVVNALAFVDIGNRADFYYTLRGLLITKRDDVPLFDAAFNEFWRKRGDGGMDLKFTELDRPKPKPKPVVAPPSLGEEKEESLDPSEAEEDDDLQTLIEITQTYSDRERLREKDFADMTPDELAAVRQVMAQLVWRLGQRRTRRLRAGRGDLLDLRRSMRRNFRYGGEMLEWKTRVRKIKPRPLVVIADVSGSMERYTKLLLQFLYSLAEGFEQRVELFVFSTRLTRITRQLRGRNIDAALADVASSVEDWSGGTRMGDVLHTFNYQWGRRVLRGGPVVLIISDGWDRGDPDLLGKEMERLQNTCHRLVWLNPLLGSAQYEPLTRGIVAALPYIDDFLPVHNLDSLELLATHLQQIDALRHNRGSAPSLKGAAFIGKTP